MIATLLRTAPCVALYALLAVVAYHAVTLTVETASGLLSAF